MSAHFACDRCKQQFEYKNFRETAELPEWLKLYGRWHLCTNCAAQLKSFVEESKLWHRSNE